MKVLKKLWDNLEGYLCAVSLAVMLVALTIQVIARFVFSTGVSWSEELSRYFLIWLIFISASLAAQTGSHIRVDMVIKIWPKAWRPWVGRISDLIWLAFVLLLAIRGFSYTMGVFQQGQNGISLDVKLGWVYLAIPIGYTLMCVRILGNLVKSFTKERTEEIL